MYDNMLIPAEDLVSGDHIIEWNDDLTESISATVVDASTTDHITTATIWLESGHKGYFQVAPTRVYNVKRLKLHESVNN